MHIDLNSDMGESFGAYTIGADEEILRWVTSANVACGWHGGDPHVMRQTVARAKALGVAVGAHPSYPDLLGFGRRPMQITRQEARDYILYQVGALRAFVEAAGLTLQHVKPHGAIYNVAAKDRELSLGIAEAVKEAGGDLILMGLPDSEMLKAAQEVGVRIAREAFGDRAYNEDGSLVSRKIAGSLITDPDRVAERVIGLAQGRVTAITGKEIRFQAETICLHGDTPGAATIARRVRERLEKEGAQVRPLGTFLHRAI
ncbi:MAG: putative lactam utilization protein [candidate division NC10 bacterium]|nr:putative lactam utilization protein [candidate division NC10 bacterium]